MLNCKIVTATKKRHPLQDSSASSVWGIEMLNSYLHIKKGITFLRKCRSLGTVSISGEQRQAAIVISFFFFFETDKDP